MFVAYTGTHSYLLYDLETSCILSASTQQVDFDEAFSLRVDYGLSQNSEYPDIMQYKPSSAKIQPNQWVGDEYKSEFSGLLLGRCQVPDGAVVLVDSVWVIGRVIEQPQAEDQHRNRKLICTEQDMRTAWYEDDSVIRPGGKIPAKYKIPELVKWRAPALCLSLGYILGAIWIYPARCATGNSMGDDNWQNSEEMAFIPEQVEPMLTSVLTAVLANEVYDEAKVATWVDLICDRSMETLTKLNKPFKYIGMFR